MNIDRVALNCIIAIIEDGGYSNLVLLEKTKGLDVNQSRAVYATVYTTLEHLLHIDYILLNYCKRQKRTVRNILRLGLAQGLFMNTPAYAATSNAVELCKKCGKGESSGLVNAVLKRALNGSLPPLPNEPVKRLSIQYSYPEWIIEYLSDSLGLDGIESLISAPPTGMELRAQYPFTTEELKACLPVDFSVGSLDENCLRLNKGMDIAAFDAFKDGKVAVQSQGSMLICRAIGDMKGKKVLDACAAPGGKSAYIYSLNEGRVELCCWELHEHRVELLTKTLSRLHVDAVIEQKDASIPFESCFDSFDAVLVDAPCSGFGLMNEKLDIRYSKKREDIDSLVELQARILSACSKYVKTGGIMVYSTCTISPLENEKQVESFLKGHENYRLKSVPKQLLPQRDGVDGFFYAVMERCF